MDKQKLKEIIETLKEIRSETEIIVSDDVLFDGSLRILNTETMNKPKVFSNNFNNTSNPYHEEPASLKQINLIKQLNRGNSPAGISKKEAIKLIQELKLK